MLEFLLGFGSGIYIGSYYNCKPQLEELIKMVKEKIPDPTEKEPEPPPPNKETYFNIFKSTK